MNIIFPRVAQRVVLLAALTFSTSALYAEQTIDAARVREIAGWLPSQPQGFGWPISNRAAWDKLAAEPGYSDVIANSEKLLNTPLPDQPDSLYLEFSQNGNRTHWQKVAGLRRNRIGQFALAEAFENKGRFLPALEQTVAALCAEKTWVLPAHDGNLANFNGRAIVPELGATGLAAELAEADYILGDKLSPATRKLIHDNVLHRVVEPFRAIIEGRQDEPFWIRAEMNWNAVCVGNTVFAALALVDSRDERAFYAAAGEHCIANYLKGFTPDGYCAEGVGYWNYGFSHFILLTEALRQSTGGKIDLFNSEQAARAALFCQLSEILPDVYLTIADCSPGTKPSADLTAYVCRRLGLPGAGHSLAGEKSGLALGIMIASLPDDLPVVHSALQDHTSPLRSYFSDGGVLISRNTPGVSPAFGVAVKGGRNAGPHNHDDTGSFSLVLGKDMIVCDPGGEVYTKRTFGPHRFDSKVLNSYGHAVPVLAGQLQRDGAQAHAETLKADFTDASDVYQLDLRATYTVPSLEKLVRTFTFQRGTQPSLDVSDTVKFSSPQTFETALITWGKVKSVGPNVLQITDGQSRVRVTIDTQGHAFKWHSDLIDEDVEAKRKPYHLGITLDDKVTDAVVTLHIEPVKI